MSSLARARGTINGLFFPPDSRLVLHAGAKPFLFRFIERPRVHGAQALHNSIYRYADTPLRVHIVTRFDPVELVSFAGCCEVTARARARTVVFRLGWALCVTLRLFSSNRDRVASREVIAIAPQALYTVAPVVHLCHSFPREELTRQRDLQCNCILPNLACPHLAMIVDVVKQLSTHGENELYKFNYFQ